ncbi:hypothetical protein DM01DRAFT_1384433 [Hesseltinella vesiculosa]|uniref:Uncharacterized protein n=1 Tax=Hesseltinella vesiculosa TaxID=101127 RepID=A0A1X2GD92_9FUNG|nr:hypothetical protein DM01DRAFT_1384433 [Hesseltinella vesiculosa]
MLEIESTKAVEEPSTDASVDTMMTEDQLAQRKAQTMSNQSESQTSPLTPKIHRPVKTVPKTVNTQSEAANLSKTKPSTERSRAQHRAPYNKEDRVSRLEINKPAKVPEDIKATFTLGSSSPTTAPPKRQ